MVESMWYGKNMVSSHAQSLSIIIPAYNEEKRLPRYLNQILRYFEGSKGTVEIIVVDDGSSDGTSDVVQTLALQNRRLKLITFGQNRGKGAAVRSGILAAKSDLRLFADADGSTPIEEIERLLRGLESGFDIIIGSRAMDSKDCTVEAKVHRKILGGFFNRLVQALAVGGISDTQCGFKLFTRKAALSIFPELTIPGFGFDVELLFIARQKGLTILEIPVNWRESGETRVKILRDSLRMFCDIFAVRWRHRRRRM